MSDDGSDKGEGKSLGFPGTPIAVPVGPLSPPAVPDATAPDAATDPDTTDGDATDPHATDPEASSEADDAIAGRPLPARRSSAAGTRRVAHPRLAEVIVAEGAALEARLGRATAGPMVGAIAGGSAAFIGASVDAPAVIRLGLLVLVGGVLSFLFNAATSGTRRRQLRDRLSHEMAGGDDELVWAGFEAFRHARRPTYVGPGTPSRSQQVDAVIAALGEHRREMVASERGAMSPSERRERKQERLRKKKQKQKQARRSAKRRRKGRK